MYCTVKEIIAEQKVGFTYTVKATVTFEKVRFTVQSRKLLQRIR